MIHNFHIPVMGLAFTIDTPVKVAQYGISSVVSIMEDHLIEMMRRHYYTQLKEPYVAIEAKERGARENRIRDYLNLINRVVNDQIAQIKRASFETGSEILKYFEMLPENNSLRQLYLTLKRVVHPEERILLEEKLRNSITAGRIDVNIMTKVDKDNFDGSGTLVENGSDALVSLKAYAESDLTNSAVILSAGLNPRLFNYLSRFQVFDAKAPGVFEKKIVLKVSDYRSALVQGKYLAKKGLWVSEFRIESGLNCGGHAFATEGYLMGPILEEFKEKREMLIAELFGLYNKALTTKGMSPFSNPHPISITAQGGVGTFVENELLLNYYGLESVGWGTPFLLVPEATTVDAATLQLLQKAKENDLVLSRNSPLGVRFYYVKGATGEKEKQERIKRGKPGSPCTEKHLVNNTEFTQKPICTASAKYQQLKLAQLQSLGLSPTAYEQAAQQVLDKECLCIGLSNAAALTYNQTFIKRLSAVTICPGPNLVYFSQEVSLQEMVDHIYGRGNLLAAIKRPHVFINELFLYINFFKELLQERGHHDPVKRKKYLAGFHHQLIEGISYYRQKAACSGEFVLDDRASFLDGLDAAQQILDGLQNIDNLAVRPGNWL